MPVARATTEHGVVYTPRSVCEPIVRLALAPLIEGKRESELFALRVCDPAIGEGAFAIEVIRVLAEALGDSPSTRRRVAACVVGADIDPHAVARSVDAIQTFVGARVPGLHDQLRVGDALALDWPRVDAMVGNPPYVRQELLGARKRRLRAFAAYDGVADLYVYFLELAHRVLRPGGRYAWIVPNKFLTAGYARKLRALLARERSLDGIVDFARGLPLFRDADAFPCVVWGTVGAPSDKRAPIEAKRIVDHTSVARALAEPGIAHARANWQADPWHVDNREDAALLDRLASQWPRFDTVVPRPSRGIVTGCNRAFVIDAATRDRLVAEEPEADEVIRPLIRGRDVRPWRAGSTKRFVLLVDRGVSLASLPRVRAHLARFRTELEPRPPNHRGAWAGRKPGTYRWFELQDPVVPLALTRAPRLFYQDIQTAPACCLDETGALVPDTTVWIVATADRFLLALLNSPLYRWYAARRFPPALSGAVRPKLEYMGGLPIARPPLGLQARITELVDAQLGDPLPARDLLLAELICKAYELSPAERRLVRR